MYCVMFDYMIFQSCLPALFGEALQWREQDTDVARSMKPQKLFCK